MKNSYIGGYLSLMSRWLPPDLWGRRESCARMNHCSDRSSTKTLFTFQDGEIQIPQHPGLGSTPMKKPWNEIASHESFRIFTVVKLLQVMVNIRATSMLEVNL